MPLRFDEQLNLVLIDKALIGLLIVVATYCANRVLESFKSREALANEISKLRIPAMNESWAAVYSWLLKANLALAKATDRDAAKTEVATLAFEPVAIIEKNRFLTGNTFANDCLHYSNIMLKYYMNIEGMDFEGMYKSMKDSGDSIITSFQVPPRIRGSPYRGLKECALVENLAEE